MIKKLSILFTFILIINLQFSDTQNLGFSTLAYATENNVNVSASASNTFTDNSVTGNQPSSESSVPGTGLETLSNKNDTNNNDVDTNENTVVNNSGSTISPLVNKAEQQQVVNTLEQNYQTNISVFNIAKPTSIFSPEDFDVIEKYKDQVIPVYYYIDDVRYLTDYNVHHPIYLAVELLEKQTGLNFEIVPVQVDPNKPYENQLKSRKGDEVCIDIIKSNNLTLFDARYDELVVTTPVFDDPLFIVTDAGDLGFTLKQGDKIGYDSSTYSLQSESNNSVLDIISMSPSTANKKLKQNGIDYYFTTNTLNLPTVMENSSYMYTSNQNQYLIRNMITSYNGLAVNAQNAGLVNVINKALTDNLVNQVKNYNESYVTVVKIATFYKSLTPAEIEFIQKTDTLNIVYNNSKNILHIEDEAYVGIIPDIMSQVTYLTGIKPVYTQPDTLNYIEDDFNTKAEDVNIIALYTTQVAEKIQKDFNNHEGKKTYSALFNDFSHPMEIIKYYETPDVTSLNQLKFSVLGTTTAFLENTNEFLESNNISTENLIIFDTKQELLDAIQDGTVDYAFVTPGTIAYFSSYTEYGIATAHVKQSIINTPAEQWTLLVHSSDDVDSLNSVLSKAISTMNTTELLEKWFTSKPEYEVYSDLSQTNQFLLYFSAVLIVIALTVLTHFNNNRQRNFNKVNKAVNYDGLTKLKNNNYFKEEKVNIIEGIFIVGSFTKFKYANQLYGTEKASQILKKQTKILKSLCGEENIYRITDEKFYLVLQDNDESEITMLTKKIFNEISEGVEIDGYNYQLGWVMAASPISLFKNKINEMVSVTNMSCENCEYNGKLKYIVVDEKEYVAISENKKIKNSLKIITQNNVYPYYQPFLDAKTLKVKGCEVLARLIINDEIIPAYKFIHEAEKLGTLGDIDEMLLEKTIALRSDLVVKGIIDSNFYFSVNLSAQYLKKMTSDDLYTLARRFNLKSFDFLQIEILEEELSKDEIVKIKRIIREFNLRTAIDDFSTGHSTIARLNNFNFDVVKMDRSLLPINFTDLDRQIYLSLISMVSGFSSEIVVEGVETEEHVDFLQKTTVSTLQGFYFAKPMASTDFVEYILTTNEI